MSGFEAGSGRPANARQSGCQQSTCSVPEARWTAMGKGIETASTGRVEKVAERRGSRTHQARRTHLTGFEVRALHRKRCLSSLVGRPGSQA